jgi:hypothetical protein
MEKLSIQILPVDSFDRALFDGFFQSHLSNVLETPQAGLKKGFSPIQIY